MPFETELAFKGLVDRLDLLPDPAEVAVAVGFVLAVRAEQAQSHVSVIAVNSAPEKPLPANRTWPLRIR